MKAIIFITIPVYLVTMFFINPLNVYSQDYVPFPTTNAIWNYQSFVPDNSSFIVEEIDGDTVINSNSYIKIHSFTYGPTSLPFDGYYYIREENKRIFQFSNITGNDTVIYDFNLNLNDTFHFCNNVSFVVYKVDSFALDCGEKRRMLHFRNADSCCCEDSIIWLEGIGTKEKYFWEGGFHLCCFNENSYFETDFRGDYAACACEVCC